jgi:hypothetical protein
MNPPKLETASTQGEKTGVNPKTGLLEGVTRIINTRFTGATDSETGSIVGTTAAAAMDTVEGRSAYQRLTMIQEKPFTWAAEKGPVHKTIVNLLLPDLALKRKLRREGTLVNTYNQLANVAASVTPFSTPFAPVTGATAIVLKAMARAEENMAEAQ